MDKRFLHDESAASFCANPQDQGCKGVVLNAAYERLPSIFTDGMDYTNPFHPGEATHLLEAGTDIGHIQKLLGHEKIETTLIYAQVTNREVKKVKSPLDSL